MTRLRGDARESGFTLIELLVASMLSVVVLVTVGGIVINALKSERAIRTANESTSSSQLAVRSVSVGVRNASDIVLTAPTSDAQLLRTRSVGSESTAVWRCYAWHFANGELRTTSSDGPVSASPTAADLETWTLLLPEVEATAAAPAGLFVLDESRIDFDFQVANGKGVPILISTSAVSRQPMTGDAEDPECF